MQVQAKCVLRCWDSQNAVEYFPNGGPLPGGLYLIDSDSQLATLTVVPVSYDDAGNAVKFYQERDGTIKARRVPKPRYVFEFDRNATRTDAGEVLGNDYTCKKCGQKFKTLNSLGVHSNQNHRDVHEAAQLAEPEFEEPVKPERRGQRKKPTFTCRDCGQVSPNLWDHRKHLNSHKAVPVEG